MELLNYFILLVKEVCGYYVFYYIIAPVFVVSLFRLVHRLGHF